MLVLTRRLNESILIGENIEIKIVQVRGAGDQAVIRIGITAPRTVSVLRQEVYEEVSAANRQAALHQGSNGAVLLSAELLEAVQSTKAQGLGQEVEPGGPQDAISLPRAAESQNSVD